MSKRISLKKLAKTVQESKGANSAAKSTSTTNGVFIREKHPRDEALDISPSEAGSKGKETMSVPKAKKAKSSKLVSKEALRSTAPGEGTSTKPGGILRPKVSILGSPSVVEKILAGVILPADKEKVDKLSLNQMVTNFFHIIGHVSIHFHP